MKKILRQILITLVTINGLSFIFSTAFAENLSSWNQFTNWVKNISTDSKPEWIEPISLTPFPNALAGAPYRHRIDLTRLVQDNSVKEAKFTFNLDPDHPDWLRISADGQFLEGNEQNVSGDLSIRLPIGVTATNLITGKNSAKQIFYILIDRHSGKVQWKLKQLPEINIAQAEFESVNLHEYVISDIHDDQIHFSSTPGKNNPKWIYLADSGILTITTANMGVEQIATNQIIYLTATSEKSGKSSSVEMIIPISANKKLNPPKWQTHFSLPDAIVTKAYYIDLAVGIDKKSSPASDQFTFELIKSSADWLTIGKDGHSLISQKIAEDAVGKSCEVTLRVTSKMSGKSTDFLGTVYVNEAPKPIEWQNLPVATLNQKYSVNILKYVHSNIKNDRFIFQLDSNSAKWLQLQNHTYLIGNPQQVNLIDSAEKITVVVQSQVSGLINKKILSIPVKADSRLAPRWKKDILSNPIANEEYRSEDLTTTLENIYPHDQLTFKYIQGPDWIHLDPLCHCLTSKGKVPENAAGKSFVVELRAQSKASQKDIDYQQKMIVYTGTPKWIKTILPPVTINQKYSLINLKDYLQEDKSEDQFTFALDQNHSPPWIRLQSQQNQPFLNINPLAISGTEVNTSQTIRLIAMSKKTRKISTQLFTIQVRANAQLPKPAMKKTALPYATVGVSHAEDLTELLQGSIVNDRLTIKLGPDSPKWLSIKNNKLISSPPHSAIGGPYPVTLLVHSQAADNDAVIGTQISVQLASIAGDKTEIYDFGNNHKSIVIRNLQKNHRYRLFETKGAHLDYGPFYSPFVIKNDQDWTQYPFYAVDEDKIVETGDEGIVSIVYYSLPTDPAPQFELLILR